MLQRLILILILSLTTSCANQFAQKDLDSPQGYLQYANKYFENNQLDEALFQFSELRKKYPRSKEAVEAELKIADIHYKLDSYMEAQVSYQLFKDLHPSYPRIDYVIFQLGMSFYKQLPKIHSRDLTLAQSALQEFHRITKNYPQSSYLKKSAENKKEIFKLLAKKELYVGRFYLKKKAYLSAQMRFDNFLKKYSSFSFADEAYFGSGLAHFKQGDSETANTLLASLKAKHPDSKYINKLEKELAK